MLHGTFLPGYYVVCCVDVSQNFFFGSQVFRTRRTRLEFLFPKKCPSILGVALRNALGAASLCLSCDEERLLRGWILHVE